MQIVLRKIRGRFDAAYATKRGSALRALPSSGSMHAALVSPTVLMILGLAFLIALAIASAFGGHSLFSHVPTGHSGFALAGVAGSLTKLKEMNETIAAKQDKLGEVFAKAGEDMDFAKSEVMELVGVKSSAEVVAKVNEMNDELADLGKKRDELNRLAEIQDDLAKKRGQPVTRVPFQSPKADDERAQKRARSLGQIITQSKAWERYVKSKQATDDFEAYEDGDVVGVKTAFTTAAGWAPQTTRVPGLVIEKATRPIQVLDLIPDGPTDQAAIVYMEETTRVSNAAERAENGTYAEDQYVLTQRSVAVTSIGSSVPVTDEQMADVAQVSAYLNTRLGFGVMSRVDSQIINGDGNSPNLAGILNKSGISTQAKSTDAAQDAFYKAMVKVRITGRAAPSAHILNPTDWQNIRLQRTADGIYIWGSPAEAGPERMWGLQVVQADSLAAGTGIVGDFNNFIQLFIRSGIEVAVGYNSTDFINGRKTVRAGMRAGLVIYRAAAFCTVTGL